MRRATLTALAVMLAAGCALLPRDVPRALKEADGLFEQGNYEAAVAAYDAYLEQYPEDGAALRARAARSLMTELIATRADLASAQAELLTARAELTAQRERAAGRDGELTRLRQEITARQVEVTRLREALEALKRTDLQMERPRR